MERVAGNAKKSKVKFRAWSLSTSLIPALGRRGRQISESRPAWATELSHRMAPFGGWSMKVLRNRMSKIKTATYFTPNLHTCSEYSRPTKENLDKPN